MKINTSDYVFGIVKCECEPIYLIAFKKKTLMHMECRSLTELYSILEPEGFIENQDSIFEVNCKGLTQKSLKQKLISLGFSFDSQFDKEWKAC